MAEVVDGLTWTRSKPDLRMYREMFGMSTAEFGRLAAVDGRTVRAWENPREWVPDRTAWMAVESLWRDAERMASGLVPEAGADPVVLPYGTGASTPACVASRIAAGRLAAAGRPWGASFPRPDGPDGGKARFRLMTDMLHLGGEKGSVLFGVTRQTVFAWRHPRMRDSVPSPAAVDALDARWSAMVARASELAGMMSVAADRAAADGRRRMAQRGLFGVAGGGAAARHGAGAERRVRGGGSGGHVLTAVVSVGRADKHVLTCLSAFLVLVDIVSRPSIRPIR
ncbi:hypothetical protein [Bifidobacterium adolescentis]|uniref:hypothetical protein n=1 Tax=Bifidobacterium adolescentis TaxID=1680 RepID=UPI0022DF0499|nr:hypothetical protein [Bifidobacterium adolescentis]